MGNSKKHSVLLMVFLMFCVQMTYAQGKKKKKDKGEKDKTEQTFVAPKDITEAQIKKADRYFFEGQKDKLTGNIESAYDNFEAAVKINPNIDATYYEMAQIVIRTGDYELSEELMEKARTISPKNTWYAEFFAEVLSIQYKDEEAAAVFRQLRKDEPENYFYYLDEAYFLQKAKKYKESLAVYDELEEKVGISEDIIIERYKAHLQLDDLDAAGEELKRLADSEPQNNRYQNMLAEFYFGSGDLEKAKEIYERILANDPNDPTATTSLADYYLEKGDHEQYVYYSKKAFSNPNISIDAKVSVLYNYIQNFEERKEEMQDAYDLADLLIETHPNDAKGYALAGDLRNINEEYDEALDFYNQSLEYRDDIFTVWQQVFFILSDKEDYENLVLKTNEAKELFPNQGILYYFNGLAYHQTEEYSKSAKSYEKGVKMTFDNPILKAQFYSNLGTVYNEMKDYEESDKSYDKALELEPDNAFVLNNYSYYLSLRKENLDKAAEMSAKSNELEPNTPSFLDTYAWILYQQGKYKEALEWQEKAIENSDPVSATLYEHYGDILFQMGDIDEAVSYWEKALEAGSDSDLIAKKIADKKLYE